jgi:hypothetical protein
MHRLRNAASTLAIWETIALGFSAMASTEAAAQPVPSLASNPVEASRESGRRDGPAAAPVSSASGTPTTTPSNVNGGYTWRNPPPIHKRGVQHRQKADPSRPQAKGPEFAIASDGSSHLSLQLSQSVEVTMTAQARQLVFELPNTQITVPNDSNPLVTTHFPTPVNRVRLLAHGKNARLVVELRESTSPQRHVRQLPNGAVVLEIVFPRSTHMPGPATGEAKRKPRSKTARAPR